MTIDNEICNDPLEIGKHIFTSYNSIFNQKDPYNTGDLQNFLGPEGLNKLGKIDNKLAVMLDSPFSLVEVSAAINKLCILKKKLKTKDLFSSLTNGGLLPHSAPSWILSKAENLASFSLKDGAID